MRRFLGFQLCPWCSIDSISRPNVFTRSRTLTKKNSVQVWDTYLEVFATQSCRMESSKIWPFRTLSVTHYRFEKQKEDVYERDIQQEEGKGLNSGTSEHLARFLRV